MSFVQNCERVLQGAYYTCNNRFKSSTNKKFVFYCKCLTALLWMLFSSEITFRSSQKSESKNI